MKVYVYKKNMNNKKRERINIIENVRSVSTNNNYFSIFTTQQEVYDYEKKNFMISVFGY